MKIYLFLLLSFLFASANAQKTILPGSKAIPKQTSGDLKMSDKIKVIQAPVRPGKPMTKIVTKADITKQAQINPGLAKFINSLPEKTAFVDGKKLTTRLYPEDGRPQRMATSKKGSQEKPAGAAAEANGEICQRYDIKVSAESENFDVPYSEQASHIYPGAAYTYNDYYTNTVSPRSITQPRNPIYLQVAASEGNGKYELVDNPDRIQLNAAAGRLKGSLPKEAVIGSGYISMVSIYSQTDFALKVNGGGGGFGFRIQAGMEMGNSRRKSYFMIDAKQVNYTINASLPEDSIEKGVFKDATYNNQNENLFMASVSYGRRVIGVVETEFETEQSMMEFKASYSSGFASGEAGLKMLNKMEAGKTKVKLYYVGGAGQFFEVPNATEAGVQQSINKWLSGATSQNAVPVSFTFRNMKMLGMRWETATDKFTYQQCVPVNPRYGPTTYRVVAKLVTVTNSKQETVRFGIDQYVGLGVGNGWVNESSNQTNRIICWWEGASGCEQPADFTKTLQVNRSRSYVITQEQKDAGAFFEVHTNRIVTYRTSAGGSKNDRFPNESKRIAIKDMNGGGNFQVDVNLNGRIFSFNYTLVINEIPGAKIN